MRRLAAVSILTLAFLAASAATGIAALPTFSNTKVKPNKSIGGVAIGMTKSKANKAWGRKGVCGIVEVTPVCQFESKKSPESGRAFFGMDVNNRVFAIVVSALPDEDNPGAGLPLTKGPLLTLETTQGLSLLDRFTKFKKLYPDATDIGDSYAITKRGVTMLFQFSTGQQPRLIGMGMYVADL